MAFDITVFDKTASIKWRSINCPDPADLLALKTYGPYTELMAPERMALEQMIPGTSSGKMIPQNLTLALCLNLLHLAEVVYRLL